MPSKSIPVSLNYKFFEARSEDNKDFNIKLNFEIFIGKILIF